jgi:hypothetical protein
LTPAPAKLVAAVRVFWVAEGWFARADLRLLLAFAKDDVGKAPSDLALTDLDAPFIVRVTVPPTASVTGATKRAWRMRQGPIHSLQLLPLFIGQLDAKVVLPHAHHPHQTATDGQLLG